MMWLWCLLCLLALGLGAVVRPIRSVGIVGSGPGGLSLAAALQQLDAGVESITIFEKRASHLQAELGGGVQLSGGAAVLSKLGGLSRLRSVAQPVQRVFSRNARQEQLLDIDVTELLERRAPSLLAPDGGEPLFFSIMRDSLQELLWELAQPSSTATATKLKVVSGLIVVSAEELEGGGAVLVCSDGQRHEFDLVVGSDGARSVVREEIIRSQSSSSSSPVGLRDTGLEIIYGVTCQDDEFSLRPGARGCFHQWFGDSAYALSASYGARGGHIQHMVGLVLRSTAASKTTTESVKVDAGAGENTDWAASGVEQLSKQSIEQTVCSTTTVTREQVQELLLRAGLSAPATGLVAMVDSCERFIRLRVKDRSAPLLRWSSPRGRLAVLGDAAHPMAPFLGQGANQAIQDSYVLARTIQRVNSALDPSSTATQPPLWMRAAAAAQIDPLPIALLCEYQRPRFLPTTLLSLKSNFLGQVETLGGPVGGLARDSFFRVTTALGVAQSVLLSGAIPKLE